MRSKADPAFWTYYERLPAQVQDAAREKHALWLRDRFHRSLHFKELHPGLWSVRVNMQYRALGRSQDDLIVWFWVGTHNEYDRLIAGV